MLDLYQVVREMLSEAQIMSLEAVSFLREIEHELERYAISSRGRSPRRQACRCSSLRRPTRKMRERQRLRLRARLYSLAEVIEERATERLGGWEQAEEASETRLGRRLQGGRAGDREAHRGRHAHAHEARTQGQPDDDRGSPRRRSVSTTMSSCRRTSPRRSRRRVRAEREQRPGSLRAGSEESESEAARHLEAFRERLAASLAQGDLTEGHDVSDWVGEVAPEDEERLLHHYLSGEQLVGAGLPEWRRWTEEFKPYLEGDEGDGGVAVVVDAGLGELDADGRYRSHSLARLGDVLDVQAVEHGFAAQHGRPLAELLTKMYAAARACTCVLLAYLQVIAEASAGDAHRLSRRTQETPRPVSPRRHPAREVEEHLLADLRLAAECYNLLCRTGRSLARGDPRSPAAEVRARGAAAGRDHAGRVAGAHRAGERSRRPGRQLVAGGRRWLRPAARREGRRRGAVQRLCGAHRSDGPVSLTCDFAVSRAAARSPTRGQAEFIQEMFGAVQTFVHRSDAYEPQRTSDRRWFGRDWQRSKEELVGELRKGRVCGNRGRYRLLRSQWEQRHGIMEADIDAP